MAPGALRNAPALPYNPRVPKSLGLKGFSGMAGDKGRKSQSGDDLLDWFTISYRTIYLVAGALIAIGVGAGGFYYLKHKPVSTAGVDTPAPEALTTARFTSLEGNIKVKAVGTFEWITADKDIVLKRGDLVKTGSGSTAEIRFFDNTVVHVRPESLITIEETSENPTTKERRVAWHISSGEVTFNAPRRNSPSDGRTEITTPLTRVSTNEEAEGAIGVRESGESDIRLFRGPAVQVEMTKTGEKLSLGQKEAVKVDPDGRAGPKVSLPGAPQLLSPADQADLAYADPGKAITPLVWKTVPGALRYHLVVDFSPTFNKPLVDQKGIEDTSRALTSLDVGRYFWRVAAIDKDNNEGDFSEFGRFSVTKLTSSSAPPPPLMVDSFDLRANILQIKGRTEPGATVSVNGQPMDVQPNGSFNEFITLEKAGPQPVVIRAVGISGGVKTETRNVSVSY